MYILQSRFRCFGLLNKLNIPKKSGNGFVSGKGPVSRKSPTNFSPLRPLIR